jgi:hypothetical protein
LEEYPYIATLSDMSKAGTYKVKATCGSVDPGDTITVAVIDVQITDGSDNPITTTQTVCVGEKITVKAKIEPTGLSGPWQWTIPGTMLRERR